MAQIQQVRSARAAEEQLPASSDGHRKLRPGAFIWLQEIKARDLVCDKRRLVEVPYTASLAHTVNALVTNRVSIVPVAAPPGRWAGGGGSLILESDPAIGAVRKHYVGMVTMLDVLAHISELGDDGDDGTAAAELDRRMAIPVSAVIGHSLERLSLWTLSPNAGVLDCMETLSKGVHRALVPIETQVDQSIAVELVGASPGYRMLTQMDVLSFLRSQQSQELKEILSHTVTELGAVNDTIYAVGNRTRVSDVIKAMRAAGLSAVPVVDHTQEEDRILQDGKGKRMIETFSATDVRGCPIVLLRSWLGLGVTEFKERLMLRASAGCEREDPNPVEAGRGRRRVVSCNPDTSLFEAIELAVSNHVHRVWVVQRDGSLRGVVPLTSMVRTARESMLRASIS